jgi:hypothetical protein
MSVPAGTMLQNLQNMSPEDIQQVLGLGEIPDKQSLLMQQLKQANLLRNSDAPEGRYAGHMYVAPNPLEILGHVAQQYEGLKGQRDVDAQSKELMTQQTAGRNRYFQLLQRMLAGQGGVAAPGAAGDTGSPEGGDY